MAAFSAFFEFLGGFFGWLVLANTMKEEAFAVLFGIVGGIMVTISITDLLPTAHRYDPDNTVLTHSFVFGMFFMSISLVLLKF
jgi:ZIP family zinc transporter